MPYKVVQTMERGRLRLTSVPDQWEKNGTLFWPKNKQEKLRRQENCNPDPTWTAINCLVKRSNLRSFKDAEAEIDAMSDRSDTETDNENRFRTREQTIYRDTLAKSFNTMAQELVVNNDEEASTAAMTQQETITSDESYVAAVNIVQNQEPISFPEEINIGTENIDNQSILILNQDINLQQIQADMQNIKQDVKTILNNQNALFELQNKLLIKHSELQTQFEEYIIKLSSKSQVQNQDDAIKIIKSLNDLDDFEKNLSDNILKGEYQKKLRGLCNRGSGKGTSNAYYLIDHLFDREFLKSCSWTGSSKETDTEKICFKAFQKTIKFFLDVVKESDETFTKADCEKFFKIVLKNARQRCESNKRTSTSRQRVKGRKTKKDTIATSSVPAIPAEQSAILDQPALANQALPATESLPEQNQREVANV